MTPMTWLAVATVAVFLQRESYYLHGAPSALWEVMAVQLPSAADGHHGSAWPSAARQPCRPTVPWEQWEQEQRTCGGQAGADAPCEEGAHTWHSLPAMGSWVQVLKLLFRLESGAEPNAAGTAHPTHTVRPAVKNQ